MASSTSDPDLLDPLLDLVSRWAAAESAMDGDALDALTDPGFRLVGPAGFVLDREQWRARFERGLAVREVVVEDAEAAVASGGATGTVISLVRQSATYEGRPADGTFRVTHVATRGDDGWRLLGIQLSPYAGPPAG